jgi:hypothetical protein
MDIQHIIHAQLENLNSVIPPHILVPALIGILTVIVALIQISRSIEKDIYEAPEKHVLKVEEVHIKTLPY